MRLGAGGASLLADVVTFGLGRRGRRLLLLLGRSEVAAEEEARGVVHPRVPLAGLVVRIKLVEGRPGGDLREEHGVTRCHTVDDDARLVVLAHHTFHRHRDRTQLGDRGLRPRTVANDLTVLVDGKRRLELRDDEDRDASGTTVEVGCGDELLALPCGLLRDGGHLGQGMLGGFPLRIGALDQDALVLEGPRRDHERGERRALVRGARLLRRQAEVGDRDGDARFRDLRDLVAEVGVAVAGDEGDLAVGCGDTHLAAVVLIVTRVGDDEVTFPTLVRDADGVEVRGETLVQGIQAIAPTLARFASKRRGEIAQDLERVLVRRHRDTLDDEVLGPRRPHVGCRRLELRRHLDPAVAPDLDDTNLAGVAVGDRTRDAERNGTIGDVAEVEPVAGAQEGDRRHVRELRVPRDDRRLIGSELPEGGVEAPLERRVGVELVATSAQHVLLRRRATSRELARDRETVRTLAPDDLGNAARKGIEDGVERAAPLVHLLTARFLRTGVRCVGMRAAEVGVEIEHELVGRRGGAGLLGLLHGLLLGGVGLGMLQRLRKGGRRLTARSALTHLGFPSSVLLRNIPQWDVSWSDKHTQGYTRPCLLRGKVSVV